jgi:Tfp pilus assembly protein PilF
LEAYPDPDSNLLMLRADLLYALEQYADAAEAYRRAAGRNTRHAGQAWLMAGYAAWQIKDLTASRRDFQRAADYDRQRQPALQAMRRLEAQATNAN